MTRKDYVLIAEALNKAVQHAKNLPTALAGVEHAAHELAHALSRDNPRFDGERFLKACGVGSASQNDGTVQS